MKQDEGVLVQFSTVDQLHIIEAYKKNPDGRLSVRNSSTGPKLITDRAQAKNAKFFLPTKDAFESIKDFTFYFTDQMVDFNMYLFLAQFAFCLYHTPKALAGFELIYREKPDYYYQNAVLDEYYNSVFINDGDLHTDIGKRRIYSVLLAAESDEVLLNRICELLYSIYPSLRALISKLGIDLMEMLEKSDNTPDSNTINHVVSYLLIKKYGNKPDSEVFNCIIYYTKQTDNICYSYKDGLPFGKGDMAFSKETLNNLEFENERVWKAIKAVRTVEDLQAYGEHLNKELFGANPSHFVSQEMVSIVAEEWKKILGYSNQGVYRTALLVEWFTLIANSYNIHTTELLNEAPVRSEKREFLIALLESYISRNKSGIRAYMTTDLYAAAVIFDLLMQKIVDGKEMYFKHNNETMYSQIGALETRIASQSETIEDLQKTISAKDEENSILREEIASLSSDISKEAKELLKPQLDENAQLRKQIYELEAKLKAEEQKTQELNLLREYAFDTVSGYSVEEEITLGTLIDGKKIVIIGGHINWRNNLKKKYPSFQIYDGHVETADLKPLETADFVFLNVSNMNHGMYYKVMGVLRNCGTPFDYLGRTINQELYEKEMADILLKRMAKV